MTIDDILKSLGHQEHSSRECSDSEVITTAVALHFGSDHSDAIGFVQESGLMPQMVQTSRFSRRILWVGELVVDMLLQLGHVFKSISENMLYRIDSFPINFCYKIRTPRSRLFKQEQYRGPQRLEAPISSRHQGLRDGGFILKIVLALFARTSTKAFI